MTIVSRILAALTLFAMFPAICGGTTNAATHHYVVANNNTFPSNTVSLYEVSDGSLVLLTTVPTGGTGSGGGYFAGVTQSITRDGANICLFAANASSLDISAMEVSMRSPYLEVVSNYVSPDGGAAIAGLGITTSGSYLYANYTGNAINGGTVNPAIGVWKIRSGCTLSFVRQLVNTSGPNGGAIDGMAVTPNGKYLVVAYGDGSVGSYAIGDGNISLIGQEIIAGNALGTAEAEGVAISSNGQWAIFGDFTFNGTQLDVASIGSDGTLAPTVTYGGTGSLGDGVSSGSIQLSPDNDFIYDVDTYPGQETMVSFDKTTGVITYPNGCLTTFRGYKGSWVYASQAAMMTDSGSGAWLYISEGLLTGGESYIALLRVDPRTGCTKEVPNSPFVDANGYYLQSITMFSQ
jgi:WD40 repeat protein